MKLPSWPASVDAVEAERERWREILRMIREHEYEHRDRTIEVAGALLEELSFLRAGGCAALTGAVRAAVAIADERLRGMHEELDASIRAPASGS